MGSFIKCFDVVSSVVEEASSQFFPLWKANDEKYKILKEYCEAIDSLAAEFNGESFEATIDDTEMTIEIKMECMDINIESQTHRYYDLIQRAVSFGFSVSGNGNLVVKFLFPSIWDEVV